MDESQRAITTESRSVVKREKDGRWLPGVSPNPSGRPKSLVELSKTCQQLTPEIIENLMGVVRSGRGADKVSACRLLLEYGYGRPFIAVDLNVTNEPLLPEQRQDRIRELAAKALDAGTFEE